MGFFNDEKPKPKKSKVKPKKSKVKPKKSKVKHNCSTCPLDVAAQIGVRGEGEKKILILTEQPLIGNDERWFLNQLNYNDIYYDDCWFSSVTQCAGKVTNKVVNCCRQQWQKLVKELKPEKILLLGHTAVKSFVGDRMNSIGKMERWVGHSIPDQDYRCWVYPLFDIDFVRGTNAFFGKRNEAIEYVFSDQLNGALEHNKKFITHKETVNVITDVKEAITWLKNINSEYPIPEWVSFDYEGTGLKPYREEQELYSISFATDDYNCTSFPLFDNDAFHDEIKQVLANPSIKKTAHNISFEQKWTRHVLGFEVEGNAFCSMLACHVLDNRTGIAGLKFQTYIDYGVAGYDDEMKQYLTTTKDGEDEKSDNRLNNIHKAPLDKLLHYGGLDSMFGYRLAMDQIKKLTEQGLDDVYDFFFDGVLALANVTENGMRIDEDYFNKTNIELETKLAELENKIYTSKEHQKWFKIEESNINILSSPQMKKLVLDVLKLKTAKKTKGGNYSVDKEVLNKLGEKHQFFKDVIKYKETHKIKGTYVEGFLRESIAGIIHPNQNLHTTKTYRPSTTSPNFANIPKRDPVAKKMVRSGVIPKKDNLLLTVDFSQIEVCSGCFYHKDPVMIDYIKTGNDMHKDEALNIFLLDEDQLLKSVRDITKNKFVFPEFYGSYWGQCAKSLWEWVEKMFTTDGILIKDHLYDQGIKTYKQFESHVKEEERIFWKEKFKVYAQWKEEAWEKYLELGYVEYLTGFRCGGVLDKKNVSNYPPQGTAFHILLWSLIELEHETRTQGWRSKVCLQVYDEMIFDVHPDEQDELVPLIKETMTLKTRKEYPWINVPLSVEIKTSKVNGNWFDMEELK